jgi:hypothetical protein
MRTPSFLLVGFLLLAASMLGKLFSSNYPGATYAATWAFVAPVAGKFCCEYVGGCGDSGVFTDLGVANFSC